MLSLAIAVLFMLVPITSKASSGFQPMMIRGVNPPQDSPLASYQYQRLRQQYNGNAVRIFLNPYSIETEDQVSPQVAWNWALQYALDEMQELSHQGMMAILVLGNAPWDYNGVPSNSSNSNFWADPSNEQLLINCWNDIVQKFAPYRNYIYGYDILNEPSDYSVTNLYASNWPTWSKAIVASIRQLDTVTPIIFEPTEYAALPSAYNAANMQNQIISDPKVIYSFHMYDPHPYTHQGLSTFNNAPVSLSWPDVTSYPGVVGGVNWNNTQMGIDLQPVINFQNTYHVPIYVGEFGAARWALGASTYIRDAAAWFEKLGWSWSTISYMGWDGWDMEYENIMTSDPNRAVAQLSPNNPSDRALALRANMTKNNFVAENTSPWVPYNLVPGGDFLTDSNGQGVADYWMTWSGASTDLYSDGNGNMIQQVTTSQTGTAFSNMRGNSTGIIAVSDHNKYHLHLNLEVNQGSIQIVLKTFDRNNATTGGSGYVVGTYGPTNGQFVTIDQDIVPPANSNSAVLMFNSTNGAADFSIEHVQMLDEGIVVQDLAPTTTVTVNNSTPSHALLTFTATPVNDGSTVAYTEYRIEGQGYVWNTVPTGGLLLTQAGSYIVGYRSVDSLGRVESAKAVKVSTISNDSFELPSTSNYIYGPMTNGWIFDSHAGVQTNGSTWSAPNAPDGTQTAFLQNGGTITQTLNFAAGTYTLSFEAALRPNNSQSINVYIDSTLVGTCTPASSTSFSAFTSNSFTVTAGNHVVTLQGTNTSGDNSAFVDLVTIDPLDSKILSDTFTGTTIDTSKWNIIDMGLQSTAVSGITASENGTLQLSGTTSVTYWAGKSVKSVSTFNASSASPLTVTVDRVSLSGTGTGYRSSLWLWVSSTQYIHFSQDSENGEWSYNQDGGVGVGTLVLNSNDPGNHQMKLVHDGSNVHIFLDGVEYVSLPVAWNQNMHVILTGQARESGDTVNAVFDNLNVFSK